MTKAVISTGGKQYLVSEGEVLDVEVLSEAKTIDFEPLLVIKDDKTTVGQPLIDGVKVTAQIVAQTKADKVTAIRYKAKKRVRKVRGHRQHKTQIKILKIA